MEITIERNKLCNESQSIKVDNNLLTLIGENGCGKSTILRSIFSKYLNDNDYNVISFSSGQNELFSTLFNEHKRRSKRFNDKEENEVINSFYFNYDWVRTLIFFASILKPNGNVRKFLVEKHYVKENNLRDDISSRLSFTFRIRKDYKMRIIQDYRTEESSSYVLGETKLIRKTNYHETIERIIEAFDLNYSFDDFNATSLRKRVLMLDFNKSILLFPTKNPFDVFTFWALATTGWGHFFEISETRLKFENDMEFRNLSDGEYQLLSVYALTDLFDAPNTLFLLDEIDSHLYYKNINLIWDSLKRSKGYILTTTHTADSIVINELEGIRLVENGRIKTDSNLNVLLDRLESLSGSESQKKKLAAKVEYLALVEDQTDWIIFTELAKIKLGESYDHSKMSKVHYVKCSGGYNRKGDDFGGTKKQWVKDFAHCKNINTKEIFLICDRDDLQIGNMVPIKDPRIDKDPFYRIILEGDVKKNLPEFKDKKTPHLISWRRREIENYLFTHQVIKEEGILEVIRTKFGEMGTPNENETMDNSSEIRDKDLKEVLKSVLYKEKEDGSYDLGRWDYDKLNHVLDIIPPSEISEDIVGMYNFIVSKVN